MQDSVSPYAIPAKRQPAPGKAIISRCVSHYRRTVNGAWVSNGSTETFYEVPVEEVPNWLNAGYACTDVLFDDGTVLGVDGYNTPVRGYGWGPLGQIEVTDMRGHKRKELVQLCDKLPGHGLFYGGVRQVKPEDRATFTTDYTI